MKIYRRENPVVTGLFIAPAVKQAIEGGGAVVALESAVITHGLPIDAALKAVRRQSQACERLGAVPAVVAVFEGRLQVGLSAGDCAALAARPEAAKVSPWNLASTLLDPGIGGTTVAATVLAAALAGIRVVSTGGIGGVHPGGGDDVSADLGELSRRPVCVVCAGPKSTLDATATLERLETLGVPVLGWQSDRLAGFLTEFTGLAIPARVDTVAELVRLLRHHWELGGAGAVVSQPLPGAVAIPAEDLTSVDDHVLDRGPGRTPAELSRLQNRLGPRVVEANVALLEHNATLAAQLALGLAGP